MDFTFNQLMDVALDVIGYLAAGALTVLVYRMAERRPKKTPPPPVLAEQPTPPLEQYATPKRAERPSMQFVTLGGNEDPPMLSGKAAVPSPAVPTPVTHRQRAEIIKMARQMLASGLSNEKIQQVLPVSEAELSLLNLSKSR